MKACDEKSRPDIPYQLLQRFLDRLCCYSLRGWNRNEIWSGSELLFSTHKDAYNQYSTFDYMETTEVHFSLGCPAYVTEASSLRQLAREGKIWTKKLIVADYHQRSHCWTSVTLALSLNCKGDRMVIAMNCLTSHTLTLASALQLSTVSLPWQAVSDSISEDDLLVLRQENR